MTSIKCVVSGCAGAVIGYVEALGVKSYICADHSPQEILEMDRGEKRKSKSPGGLTWKLVKLGCSAINVESIVRRVNASSAVLEFMSKTEWSEPSANAVSGGMMVRW